MPIVKPVSDLQRNINAIYELCHSTKEPVYITRNGHADLVVMDAEAFDEQFALGQEVYEREMRTYEGIMRGYQQMLEGKMTPWSEVKKELGWDVYD